MKRQTAWILVVALVVVGFSFLIPASPWYFPNFFSGAGKHQGQPTSYWIKTLDSDDVEARREAIFALGCIGAPEVVPRLSKILLEDGDAGSRRQAGLALLKIFPVTHAGSAPRAAVPAHAAVPALVKALSDEDAIVRMNAAMLLARFGSEAKEAIPALVAGLGAKINETDANIFHFTVTEMMAQALAQASAGTADGVPALTALLQEGSSESTIVAALQALGTLGKNADPAVPLIRALLKDNSRAVQTSAAEALQLIQGMRQ
ncbi:MAG: HEAT repeat domain-containing protein [Gemmataceae bacterium]|nr:HEAT repeat domain-containing protein [Gemmataceae bacterium]MCI0742826.1 HEAT repeat domain-containing protein [Gemmataceae bacterium]